MTLENGDTSVTIGIVVQDNYPLDRDVRTRKMAKALDDSGWKVQIFARNSLEDPDLGKIEDDYSLLEEELGYATVKRFSWLLSTPLFSLVTAKIPINPFWLVWLVLQLRESDVDAVVACDVRAGLPSIFAAKLCRLPVILDLRENFAELAKIKQPEGYLDYLTLNVTLISTIEQVTVRLADHVWVVTEERKQALVADTVSPANVSVVGNTPYLDEVSEFAVDEEAERESFKWSGFTLVYVGSINRFRGIDLILEAISCVNQDNSNPVSFAVAGDGPDRDRLEQKAKSLGIDDAVHFTGWIDPETVPAFLRSGDVGVIPHTVNTYTNQTIPNKLFDYMLAELPVLATAADPISRVIRETECGRVVPDGADGREVGKIIKQMRDCSELTELGQHGLQAVQQTYNWNTEMEQIRATLRAEIG